MADPQNPKPNDSALTEKQLESKTSGGNSTDSLHDDSIFTPKVPGAGTSRIASSFDKQTSDEPALEPTTSPVGKKLVDSAPPTKVTNVPGSPSSERSVAQPPGQVDGRATPSVEKSVDVKAKLNQSPTSDSIPLRPTQQETVPAKAIVPAPGDMQGRVSQPAQVADNVAQAALKNVPVESKTSEALKPGTDSTGGNRSVQNIEPSVAPSKNVVTNPVERSQPGDVSSARTITPPVAAQNVGQQKVETSPASVQSTRGTVESLSGNVSTPVPRQEVKSVAGEVVPAMPGNQIKGEPRADQSGVPTKLDPRSDLINTQGAPLQANDLFHQKTVANGECGLHRSARDVASFYELAHDYQSDHKAGDANKQTFDVSH